MGLFDNVKSSVTSAVKSSLSERLGSLKSKLENPDKEKEFAAAAQETFGKIVAYDKAGDYQNAFNLHETLEKDIKANFDADSETYTTLMPKIAAGKQEYIKKMQQQKEHLKTKEFTAALTEGVEKARALGATGKFQEAIDLCESLEEKLKVEFEPDSEMYKTFVPGLAKVKQGYLDLLQKKARHQPAKDLKNKAIQLFKSGNYQESIDTIELYREETKTLFSGEALKKAKAEQLVEQFIAMVHEAMNKAEHKNNTASVSTPAFCSSCGAKLNEGAKFCPGCGSPVEAK